MNIEMNPLPNGYHKEVTDKISRSVPWYEPGLYVIRFRLISDPGFPVWDVSYCHGRLSTGEIVDVQLPFTQVPKGANYIKFLLKHAKQDRVYLKALGLLENVSKLNA